MRSTFILPFVSAWMIFAVSAHAQQKKIVRFRQQTLLTKPKYFYIEAVSDDRPDTTMIGTVRASALSTKSASLDFEQGAARAIDDFLHSECFQNRSTTPFILHITHLELAESTGGLKSDLELRMSLAVYIGKQKLTDFKVNNSVQAGVDATRFAEELIRRGLDATLQNLNDWFNEKHEEVLAAVNGPRVLVLPVIGEVPDDTATIVYSPKRPLTLDDFMGKPNNGSQSAASTIAGIDLKFRSREAYGQTRVEVTLLPVFDKRKSWCKKYERSAQTLAHEQIHFDLVAIATSQLADTLRKQHFTAAFENEIQELFEMKQQELQTRQEQYDKETNHGLIPGMQDQWEKKVRAELLERHILAS